MIMVCISPKNTPLRDWDWRLKRDWATLPNLETLCLDLRPSSQRLESRRFYQQGEDQKIVDGAKRMECLLLKSLIIYGLCSRPDLCHDEQHKQKIDELFRKALARDRVLEFRDLELGK